MQNAGSIGLSLSNTIRNVIAAGGGGGPAPEGYLGEVFADSPVSLWILDEIAAGAAVDYMGVEDGAYAGDSYPTMFYGYNASSLINTESGSNAQKFYNSWDERVAVPNNAAHNFTGTAYTIACVVKRTRATATERVMSKATSGAFSERQWDLFFHSSDVLNFSHYTTSLVQKSITYPMPIGFYDDEEHYIHAVNDGSDIIIYVDGEEVARGVGDGGSSNSCTTQLILAALGPTGISNNLHGTLQYCAVYDKALSASRVAAQYVAGKARSAGAFTLYGASYSSISTAIAGSTPNISSVRYSADGSKLFEADSNNVLVRQKAITSYGISGGVDQGAYDASAQFAGDTLTGVEFKPDGTKMYLSSFNGYLHEYLLSTAWDVTTSTHNATLNLSGTITNVQDLRWNSDGTSMYLIESATESIQEFTEGSVAYSLSGLNTTANTTLDLSAEETNAKAFAFSPDDKNIYMVGSVTDTVYRYVLRVAGDLSTGGVDAKSYYVDPVEIGEATGNATGLDISPDGEIFIVADAATDKTYQFSFGIST